MQFVVTAAGEAASIQASKAGIDLVFSNFKVGSAFGYTPNSGDTALHGTTLYTGVITGFAKTTQGNLQFLAIMDKTVGDFAYGELGLYVLDQNNNEILFALGALPALQEKYASPSQQANQINEIVQVVLSGAIPNITWISNPLTSGSILEVANWDLLLPPASASSNAVIVHSPDDFGNHPFVYTDGSSAGIWTVSTHGFPVYSDSVVAAVTGSPSFFGNISKGISSFPDGRYIIQFTSGNSKGLIRKVVSISGAQITMDTALGIAAGDTFTIWQSTMSYIELSSARVGEVRMWSGAIANISQVWGAGWHLCDGTNGTPNLTDKMVIGAGNSYAPGATGGSTSTTLSLGNLPSHTHTINDPGHAHVYTDPGHAHGVYDPGHGHGVSDPGHQHAIPWGENGTSYPWGAYSPGGNVQGSGSTDADQTEWYLTSPTVTGIGIAASGSNIGIYSNGVGITIHSTTTGITVNAAGSTTPTPVATMPPYYALAFVMYTGA